MMQNDSRRPQEPTMQGYVMRIVLQILRDADSPLSNSQIEQGAAAYFVDVKTATGMVKAGGHPITDTRTTIKRLKGMGYNIQSEWRKNQFGDRYKVYWLEEQPRPAFQLTIFDIEGV